VKKISFKEYRFLVLSDLYRHDGGTGLKLLIRELLFAESFKYNFWMRTCLYIKQFKVLKYSLYPIALYILRHYTYKFGISIPFNTCIGAGFYIGHFSGIIVSPDCIIGKNCNISQGVTLGQANRGDKKGSPVIGNNVYIGPGAKLIGKIFIGDNVAIGANSVVTKDVENNAVVAGAPARVLSMEGTDGYVTYIDYEEKLG
jgi:serine O-acetyltransferase